MSSHHAPGLHLKLTQVRLYPRYPLLLSSVGLARLFAKLCPSLLATPIRNVLQTLAGHQSSSRSLCGAGGSHFAPQNDQKEAKVLPTFLSSPPTS